MAKNHHMLKCIMSHTHGDAPLVPGGSKGFLRHALVWVCKIIKNKNQEYTGFGYGKVMTLGFNSFIMHEEVWCL